MRPSIDEHLFGVAWAVLHDGLVHELQTLYWAMDVITEHRAQVRRAIAERMFFERRNSPIGREERLAAYRCRRHRR